jgi:transglutaminase-like putative cysteine protease
VKLFRPIPRVFSRPFSILVLAAWVAQMGVLGNRACVQGSPVALAGDLAQYGSGAQWKGVYYRGEKIGFMVGQTVATTDGYALTEEGRLQMVLLGAPTAARIKTVAQVDRTFGLRSFAFSLDPGSGAIEVKGALEGRRLHLSTKTAAGERTETRDLPEAPMLSMNLPRQLAARGLVPGQEIEVSLFDPATLRNAPMAVEVKAREVVEAGGRPVPAFRVETRFSGITSTSWITDVGEVVREESPMGLIVVRETPARAQALAVPGRIQTDMLEAAAIVPRPARRIDDERAVLRLRVRLEGAEGFSPGDLEGAGQSVSGNVFEVSDARTLAPGPRDPEAVRSLGPEPFVESDAPEIVAEARRATEGLRNPREKAERLVRHVNAILEKKPTVSLPSALEVLRTRVGDCNEHAALFVALARALEIPARMAVGLVHVQGAFYYHAWAEVYVQETRGRGLWLPVDPTLNEFPADATHIRLARGGLERQAAIVGLVGRAKMAILDVDLRPGSTPVLVGRQAADRTPIALSIPRRDGTGRGCWSSPAR